MKTKGRGVGGRDTKRVSLAFLALRLLIALALSPMCWSQSPPPPASPNQKEVASAQQELATAKSLSDSGKVDEALVILRKLENANSELPGLNGELGKALYRKEEYGQAVPYFRHAIDENSSDKESVQLLGLSLFRIGKPAEAIPLLKQVTSWYPAANVDASYVLGLCYIQVQNYSQARQAFAAMYGVPPESAASHLILARMLLRQGFDPIAEENARQAIALDPKLPLAHYLLGEFHLFKSDIPQAIAEFEKEIELNPGFAGVYDRMGDAYTHLEKFDDAQRMLQRSVALDPNSTGPFILLGKVMLKKNDPKSAAMYLERAAKMDPNNYMTHHLLGQAYRSLGQENDAEREFKIAEQLQKRNE